jgi:hypothetical protein
MTKLKGLLLILVSLTLRAQPPIANFSMSPTPLCSGHVLQITDLSTGNPTAWSYTISGGMGPGGGNIVLTSQNPTVILNNPVTYTVSLVASNASGSSQRKVYTIQVIPSPQAQINPALRNTCPGGVPITISVTSGGFGGASYTYSWSNSASGPSITVQPSVTTVYTCVISGTNGCSVARTVTVVVASPTISLVSLPYNLCPGVAATITAIGQQPSPFSYTWSTGDNSNVITTNTAGVYNVTVTNGANCTSVASYTLGSSSTLSITATSSPPAICSGSTALLEANGAGSYTWNNGSNSQAILVNPTVNTTYTVMGELSSCTGSTTVMVTVNVMPTITVVASPPSLCAGKSATLTATGAQSFTWLPSSPGSTLVVTPGATTTYSVRGVNPGCPARNMTVNIVVLPNPSAGISSSADSICEGEPAALAFSGTGSYTWSTGSSAPVIIVYPPMTTTYSVLTQSANQCTAAAFFTQEVSVCTRLDLHQTTAGGLSVYPNPATDDVTVAGPPGASFIVRDISGRTVAELQSGRNQPGLKAGVYTVEAITGNECRSVKLVLLR